MESKIRDYVESVFRDVPMSERAENIQSEILSNLLDKYRDLKNQGKTDEEAYAMAISSGGDLSGIAADLKGSPKGDRSKYVYTYDDRPETPAEKQYLKEKKKCSVFSSCLWPVVLCAYFLFSLFVSGMWGYSWVIFLVAGAVDCLYAAIVIKSNRKKRNSALCGAVWTGILSLYFIFSFATKRWDVSWILFILGIPLVKLVLTLVNKKGDGETDDEE